MDPNQNQYSSPQPELQHVDNPLSVMQPGERVICEIRRHPFGLFGIYAVTAMIIAALISIAILAPYYATFLTNQQKLGVVLTAGLGVIATLIYAYAAVFIYNGNRWVVTSDSISEISRTGLFNEHNSQLSLANLEDVSVDQDGFIQAMFGFGDLHVETAGAEKNKFSFTYCPNPHEYARHIIAAHEAFIANQTEQMRVYNQPLNTAAGYNQPGYPQQGQPGPIDPTNLPPANQGY